MSDSYPEMTLRDYARIVFRHKAAFVATIATVLGATYVGLKMRTPVYEAQVKMLISAAKQVESLYYRDLASVRDSKITLTQSDIVTSNPVIERAVRATRLYQRPLDYEKAFAWRSKRPLIEWQAKQFQARLARWPEELQRKLLFRKAVEDLKRQVIVEPIRDTDLFVIKVREFSPWGAALLANAVSRSYLVFDLEQQAAELQLKYGTKHLTVKQMQDNIEQMTSSLAGGQLPDIEAIGPASVKIVEQASLPLSPIGTAKSTMMAVAGGLSLLLGLLLAFAFDFLDQTLKTPQEVKTFLGLPLLGSIPKRRWFERAVLQEGGRATRYIRFYQRLGDQVYLMAKEKDVRSILFTSALLSEGVTTIVANLGLYLAQVGHRVLLIDANLRAPGLGKLLRLPRDAGLAEILQEGRSFDQVVQQLGALHILSAGLSADNPVALLDSPRFAQVLRAVRAQYDLVLIDGAQLKDCQDSAMIASSIDRVVLIMHEGKTRRQVIKAALAPLEQMKVQCLGGILNRRTFAIPQLIYDWV